MNIDLQKINWHDWMQRWDRQQSGYLPDRERRFQAMLDVLDALLPEQFVAVDLACGPGSISQRLLTRFPQARCIAVDYDPVLLMLGQNTLGNMQGRLLWVEADLRNVAWQGQLQEQLVDAVLSTTALHWLTPSKLVELYHQLGKLIRPGGVFLNGDNFEFPQYMPSFRRTAETIAGQKNSNAFMQDDVENWRQWWDALAKEPGMEPAFAERERRFIHSNHEDIHPIAELHEAALHDAGFLEVGVIWQNMSNRIIMAVR